MVNGLSNGEPCRVKFEESNTSTEVIKNDGATPAEDGYVSTGSTQTIQIVNPEQVEERPSIKVLKAEDLDY